MRSYDMMLLREYSKEACLRIPARSHGRFGRKICGWCGEEFKDKALGEYAEHVLTEHRSELKALKGCKAK